MSLAAKEFHGRNNANGHVGEAVSQAGARASEVAQHYVSEPAHDIFTALRQYAEKKPDVAACWIFGLGFLIGWKLKS